MQENGLHTEVEVFRKKYTSKQQGMEGLRQFMDDLAHGCATPDGKINTAVYHKRLEAVKPLFNVFGVKNNVAMMVVDIALARATMTQEGAQRGQSTDGIRTQIQVSPSQDEKVYLRALAEKLGQQRRPEAPDPAPPAPTAVEAQRIVQTDRRIRGADGNYYTVVGNGQGESPLVAQRDDGELLSGAGIIDILEKGKPDILQIGKRIMQRSSEGLKIYSIHDIANVNDMMTVTLKDQHGYTRATRADIFRQTVEKEFDGWKAAKDILTTGEELVMSELSRDAWAVLMDEYPEFERVYVGNLPDNIEQNPASGGKYVHPRSENESPAVYIRKDYAPALQFIREKGQVVLDIIAQKLGVEPNKLSDRLLETFILLHEAGHGHDYKGMTSEQQKARRKADTDTLPARNLADFAVKYPQASEEQVGDFMRLYRNTTTERAADDFAEAFIKGHPELFGPMDQKDSTVKEGTEGNHLEEVPDDERERIAYGKKHFDFLTQNPKEFRAKFTEDVKNRYKEYIDKNLKAAIAAKPDGVTYPGTVAGVLGMTSAAIVQLIIAVKDQQVVEANDALRMPFKQFAKKYLDYDVPDAFDRHYKTK